MKRIILTPLESFMEGERSFDFAQYNKNLKIVQNLTPGYLFDLIIFFIKVNSGFLNSFRFKAYSIVVLIKSN